MMLMEDLLLSANKKKIISVYFRYSPKNLFAPPQKKLHFWEKMPRKSCPKKKHDYSFVIPTVFKGTET